MIRQINYEDVTVGEDGEKFQVEASGKILSIKVVLEQGVDIVIVTPLGEEILKVKNDGVYYPRSNISAEKNKANPLTGEVQTLDYYYFSNFLLIELNSEGEMTDEVALKELSIVYDDMQSL